MTACDPLERQASTIVFQPPAPRVVLPGDSVAAIALEFGATEADVRAWNRLEGREPRVGERLSVWPTSRAELTLATVLKGASPRPAATRPRPAAGHSSRARPAAEAPQNARVALGLPDLRAWMSPAPNVPTPVAVDVHATRVHGAGLLGGADVDVEGPDARAVDLLTAGRGSVAGTSLSARGGALADKGSAEALGQVATLRVLGAPAAGSNALGSGPIRPAPLPMPVAKRCLVTSTAVELGDEGIGGSRGLSASQVRVALSPFLRHASACIPAGSTGSWSASFGLTVGCDGRVSASWTTDPGGLPDRVTGCIEATLDRAAFPAHDMPAGVDLTWPITFRR